MHLAGLLVADSSAWSGQDASVSATQGVRERCAGRTFEETSRSSEPCEVGEVESDDDDADEDDDELERILAAQEKQLAGKAASHEREQEEVMKRGDLGKLLARVEQRLREHGSTAGEDAVFLDERGRPVAEDFDMDDLEESESESEKPKHGKGQRTGKGRGKGKGNVTGKGRGRDKPRNSRNGKGKGKGKKGINFKVKK